MGNSIRTLLSHELIDLINPYLEDGYVGDVLYVLMSIATKLNIEGAEQLNVKDKKCLKKSRRPIRSSEIEPVPEEGNSCG